MNTNTGPLLTAAEKENPASPSVGDWVHTEVSHPHEVVVSCHKPGDPTGCDGDEPREPYLE